MDESNEKTSSGTGTPSRAASRAGDLAQRASPLLQRNSREMERRGCGGAENEQGGEGALHPANRTGLERLGYLALAIDIPGFFS